MTSQRGMVAFTVYVVAVLAAAGAFGFHQDGQSALTGAILTGSVGAALVGASFIVALVQRSRSTAHEPHSADEVGRSTSKEALSIDELRRRRNLAAIRLLALVLAISVIWAFVFLAT